VPFPARLIGEGETVALDLRPHWWYFSRNILSGVPLVAVVIAVLSIHDDDVKKYVGYLVVILIVAWAAWLVVKYLTWTNTYFVVTSKRVIYRTGVLAKHGVEIPLDRISNINFSQTLWERMIGAGNLDIESAGRDGQTHFDYVRYPDGVQHEIYRQAEELEQRRAGRGAASVASAPTAVEGPPPPAGGAAVPDQIEQLARLRERGLITEDEYERKKQELLDRM
jgi:uncharacterized membrane protein YdbT with pleckstrin-like domain